MVGSKKILVVCTNADWAGAPIHVLTLLTILQAKFDLIVVFGEDGPVREALQLRGVPSMVISSLKSSINPINDLLSFFSMLKIVRTLRPALLHAHSSKAGMIARLVGLVLQVPCLYTVHGWGFGIGRARVQSAFVFVAERVLSLISGARYIFVSESDRRTGIDQLKLVPQSTVTVHNGVRDHGCRSDIAHNTSVIMAARVCHAKNHIMMLKAFERCTTEFKLVLVGEGTISTDFQYLVAEHAATKHHLVSRLGLSDRVPELLSESCIFVLCSRYEGLPLSIIEAMCAGMPIVATNVGGVSELVEDGVNGFLIPPNDHSTLAFCLDRLQQDSDLRARMGQASRSRYLARFCDTKMADAVAQQYCKMLGPV